MPTATLRLLIRPPALAALLASWLLAPAVGAGETPVPLARVDVGAQAALPPLSSAPLGPPGDGEAGGPDALTLRVPGADASLWPGGLVQVDALGAFGRGVSDVRGQDGQALNPRLAVRRARLDLSGQYRRDWSFYVSGDFAGTPRLEYALIDVKGGPFSGTENFHLTVGRQLLPVGLANRTFEPAFVGFERPLAVRFALPDDKDLGVMLWADAPRNLARIEVGVFGGDGGRVNVDRTVDIAARLAVRPLAASRSALRDVQIGVSAVGGTRQLDRVSYALAPVTTEGGYAFWRPQREGTAGIAGGIPGGAGGLGALSDGGLSVLPSGKQGVADVELRIPVGRLDLRAEYLYTRRQTREALVGDDGSGSRRFGELRAHSFYATAGWWLVGSPAMLGAPGQFDPVHPAAQAAGRGGDRGLLVTLRGEVLEASYDPGSRSRADGDTLGERDVRARVVDVGLNYYAGRHVAALLHYTYNVFPDSSVPQLDPSNLAQAPGNRVGRSGAHQLHELGARMQVSF